MQKSPWIVSVVAGALVLAVVGFGEAVRSDAASNLVKDAPAPAVVKQVDDAGAVSGQPAFGQGLQTVDEMSVGSAADDPVASMDAGSGGRNGDTARESSAR